MKKVINDNNGRPGDRSFGMFREKRKCTILKRFRDRIYNFYIIKDEVNNIEEIKFFRLLISIGIVWLMSGLIFLLPFNGEYGDKFGVINTLFSGLAFGGIIYTIYQQRAEFGMQREELKLQREEVANSNKEFHEQVIAINIQRFENTFFNMISLHSALTKSIKFEEYEGLQVFDQFRNLLESYRSMTITEEIKRTNKPIYDLYINPSDELHYMSLAANDFFDDHEQYIGHYCRSLYNIYRLLDENPILDTLDEKKQYSRIIRSQLSAYEYIILFYNCFQENGYKFIYYADKFELFDNIQHKLLLKEIHWTLYKNFLKEKTGL